MIHISVFYPVLCTLLFAQASADETGPDSEPDVPRLFEMSVEFKNWTPLGEGAAPIRNKLKNAGFWQRARSERPGRAASGPVP